MKNDTLLIDLVNILSFAIGIQNLELNNEQVQQIEHHLKKQDEQYEKIIKLLEVLKIEGGTDERK